MGIQGLLPLLEGISRTVYIQEFAGKRVAIDIYCWLHKGVYSCSTELCQGVPTDKYVTYCMKRLQVLIQHKVIPIVIFDGGPLPMKQGKEEERRRSRDEHKARGMCYLKEGNLAAANECFQKAVDITPEMAYSLIKALRRENIEYIVAPYEADAQLAFLSLGGFVDCVITEDSDLLAYGCSRVLFKMDKDGTGKEIRLEDLTSLKEPNFRNFTQQMLRQLCILAGCDYLPSISGLGIKKAFTLIKTHKTIERVFSYLRSNKNYNLPLYYEDNFKRAELTFLHQRVFDPTKNAVVPLTPLPDEFHDKPTDFLGPPIPDDIAIQIAVGNVDPHRRKPFVAMELKESVGKLFSSAQTTPQLTLSSSSGSLRNSSSRQLPVQKNSIADYCSISTIASKKPFLPPRTALSRSIEAETLPSPPNKKSRTEEKIIAPRSPSPPHQRVVSKYFEQPKNSITKALFQDTSSTSHVLNFDSPFVKSSGRLSLRTAGIHYSSNMNEEDSVADPHEVIQSDDEVIRSDDEDEGVIR